MQIVHNDDRSLDPEWDLVGMASCDFRPHWDGDMINLWTCVRPLANSVTTASLSRDYFVQIGEWVIANQDQFGAEDRYHLTIGWPVDIRSSGRQIIKEICTLAELQTLISKPDKIRMRSNWALNVFAD